MNYLRALNQTGRMLRSGQQLPKRYFSIVGSPNVSAYLMQQANKAKNVNRTLHGLHERKQATFDERSQLKYARRLVVKLGSAVITREDEHGLALGRLASIVEQVAEYHVEGRECIMVTSGAVAFGKQKLTQELLMSLSMRETLSPTDHTRQDAGTLLEPRAAAAVGQSGLMSLYDAMFAQYGIKIAQVLVTEPDFYNEETRKNLFSTLSELISLNIVPIINTNDAVVPPMFIVDQEVSATGKKRGIRIKDNDSLAALLAAEIHADLLILMSDVDGIYNKPPWEDGARLMHTYCAGDKNLIKFGEKSKVGTGGMNSKVMAATWALDRGVSVVICNGTQDKAIKSILTGRKVGTFFTESTTEKRALFTWFILLVFMVVLCLRLENRIYWNWFLVFIPLWLYDVILVAWAVIEIVHRQHRFISLHHYKYYVVGIVLKIFSQITICLKLEYKSIPMYVMMIPIWMLLALLIVFVGTHLQPKPRSIGSNRSNRQSAGVSS